MSMSLRDTTSVTSSLLRLTKLAPFAMKRLQGETKYEVESMNTFRTAWSLPFTISKPWLTDTICKHEQNPITICLNEIWKNLAVGDIGNICQKSRFRGEVPVTTIQDNGDWDYSRFFVGINSQKNDTYLVLWTGFNPSPQSLSPMNNISLISVNHAKVLMCLFSHVTFESSELHVMFNQPLARKKKFICHISRPKLFEFWHIITELFCIIFLTAV